MPAKPTLSPSDPAGRIPRAATRQVRAPVLLALVLASLAGACGAKDTEFPPACPGLALVPAAGDLVRFNGRGQDVVDLVTRARIIKVPAKCETVKTGTILATLHIEADVTRGPASPAATVPIGYFIALMEGNNVLQEQDFSFSATFPPNVDRTSVRGDDIELQLPVSKTKSAAAYQIYVAFRLTPEELAYNRAHPRP